MSSVTVSRDSVKARLAKQRAGVMSKDPNTTRRNTTTTRSTAAEPTKTRRQWCSNTSSGISDTISSSAKVSALSESLLESRRGGRTSRKAPLPSVVRQNSVKQSITRRTAKDPPRIVQRDDGWEADMEDAEPFVTEVKPTTYRTSRVTPVPDKKKVEEARKVLQECGVLSNDGTAAHFAALSDADYSLSPPSLNRSGSSPNHAESTSGLAKKPSMGELRDSISMLQKQVADLRSDVPSVTTNPLRDEMEMNRRVIEGHSDSLSRANPGGSSFSLGGGGASGSLSGGLTQSSSAFATSTDNITGAGLHGKRGKKRTDGRAKKVPLPADLMAGRGVSGLAAGHSAMHSGALPKAVPEGDEGNDSDASASSFGLSCGLPGLSHEVADTITHLSAAETIQASVTVTPLSLKDWLLRPVPTPMDPSLTLYGAAVHNAHVACCEVVIGGLLSAIEDGEMERPAGLPCGTYDFRSRGISDQEGLQSVLRALADWMKILEDSTASSTKLPPMDSFTHGSAARDAVSDGAILQDPRSGPLLSVLRCEALRIIGEDEEYSEALTRNRAAHLNATDMLHILTTALVPSFRQLVSRSADTPSASTALDTPEARHCAVSHDTQGTSKSSSSLFSIPGGASPEKGSESQDAAAAVEAQVAARVAATGVRPENPCDDPEDESPEVELVARDESPVRSPEVVQETPTPEKDQRRINKLAALTMMDMKKSRESLPGEQYDEEFNGPHSSVTSSSPLSRTGSISADALTDALRKLVLAGGHDGSDSLDEVDVVEMLRQLAAERVAAKKEAAAPPSAHASPDVAAAAPDTTSESTAPSSASDASQPRSSAASEHSTTTKDKHGEKETEQLQAVELEKLLQHPAVMQMLAQMAAGQQPQPLAAGPSPEQVQMQQQQAAMHAAKERERAMRYERQIAAQQQQQRMMMNTFVNMNMMQNQMANAMFSSMMTQPQQKKNVGVEKFAMLRSMAKRHGVTELSNMPLKHGASAMMGQAGMAPSMMSPPMMPSMSMMPPPMPAQPRMQTPINRFASSISMPYLQVGGQTPLPQNSPAPTATSSSGASANAQPSGLSTMTRSAPTLPAAPAPTAAKSPAPHGSLPAPAPADEGPNSGGGGASGVLMGSSATLPGANEALEGMSAALQGVSAALQGASGVLAGSSGALPGTSGALPGSSGALPATGKSSSSQPRSSAGHPRQSPPSQSQRRSGSHHGMPGHQRQSQSMMAGMMHGMNGMMPQQHMGMHPQKSASYMPGMGGSMMGGSYMGGMGQPGMMPQQGGSYMSGMGGSMMGGSYMGGMQAPPMGMGMPQMGGHPGMGVPYGGMGMNRASSMPQGQGVSMHRTSSLPHGQGYGMQRQHSSSSSQSLSGSHRPRTHTHPTGAMMSPPQAQQHGSVQRTGSGQAPNPYNASGAAPPMSQESSRSSKSDRRSRPSGSSSRQSSSMQAHDAAHRPSQGSSREQCFSNDHSLSPGGQIPSPMESPVTMPHPSGASNMTPPPMVGELPGGVDGSGSFLFDSAGSQQLAAAAANSSKPAQRQYKHLGSRTGRSRAPQLAATPEGEDEPTDSHRLL